MPTKLSASMSHFSRESNISLLSVLLIFHLLRLSLASTTMSATSDVAPTAATTKSEPNKVLDVRIVFSDVDGTLAHYPDKVDNDDPKLVYLPQSSTGMRGVLSARTLEQCRTIRKDYNRKLVLISGMRTETLRKRLPFLPKADAYASEGGGRIFVVSDSGYKVIPYDGASDSEPFYLQEDMEWRERMQRETAAGKLGYAGAELSSVQDQSEIPVPDRDGILWKFGAELQVLGFNLDTNGYAACFRVNKKHQDKAMQPLFDRLVNGQIRYPDELASSVNLGCVDFYPSISGKKNCCLYLAEKFSQDSSIPANVYLSTHAVCMCDDDNDTEMALACAHAYLPAISSDSMHNLATRVHPTHFTIAETELATETAATEVALDLIIEQLAKSRYSS